MSKVQYKSLVVLQSKICNNPYISEIEYFGIMLLGPILLRVQVLIFKLDYQHSFVITSRGICPSDPMVRSLISVLKISVQSM